MWAHLTKNTYIKTASKWTLEVGVKNVIIMTPLIAYILGPDILIRALSVCWKILKLKTGMDINNSKGQILNFP